MKGFSQNSAKEPQLMSMFVKLYNGRRWVDDCLKSVLSQTYSPLEIVISDDHSTDGTWERACEIVEAYRQRDGRHRIVLHRNEHNLGIARNCEMGLSLCTGELCFQVDGDDISFPDRVSYVVKKWEEDGRRASLCRSGSYEIDEHNHIVGRRFVGEDAIPWPFGCVNVYRKSAISGFGPIDDKRPYLDDWIFVSRSLMGQGTVLKIDEPLIFYRLGGVSKGKGGYRKSKTKMDVWRLNAIDMVRRELKTCAEVRRISQARQRELSLFWDAYENFSQIDLLKYGGMTFKERIRGFCRHPGQRARWYTGTFWFVDIGCLFPCKMTDFLISLWMRLRLTKCRWCFRKLKMNELILSRLQKESS